MIRGPGPQLVQLLLDEGLIAAVDVVDGAVVLRDRSRRNVNVLVERRGGPALFVKTAVGRDAATAEAARYAGLDSSGLADLAPRLLRHLRDRGILVLEGLATPVADLRTLHATAAAPPLWAGPLLGATLARLHRDGDPGGGPAEPPWALRIHRPPVEALRELHPSSVELTRVIQADPGLGAALDELRADWSATALAHNDLKWDNVLASPAESPQGARLWLADWEHAGPGDPMWDVGCAVAGYLAWWIHSMDVPAGAGPSHAHSPLEPLVPAITGLWDAYRAARPAGRDDLERAVRLAGARLLLTAHEGTESGGAVDGHRVLLVQVAANLLQDPGEGVATLGLGTAGGLAA